MGVKGPIPQRTEQTVRRNKPEVPVTKIAATGVVPIPELGETSQLPNHPLIEDMYRSMTESAQAKYFEPSDWQYARLTLHFLNNMLWQGKPSAMMLASVNTMLTSLLMTEGDRRRVRLEVERSQAEGTVIDVAAIFRERLEANTSQVPGGG